VFRRDGFDQYNPTFLFSDGIVEGTTRDDAEVIRGEVHVSLALNLDAQIAFDHLEQLVFVLMLVPCEFA